MQTRMDQYSPILWRPKPPPADSGLPTFCSSAQRPAPAASAKPAGLLHLRHAFKHRNQPVPAVRAARPPACRYEAERLTDGQRYALKVTDLRPLSQVDKAAVVEEIRWVKGWGGGGEGTSRAARVATLSAQAACAAPAAACCLGVPRCCTSRPPPAPLGPSPGQAAGLAGPP